MATIDLLLVVVSFDWERADSFVFVWILVAMFFDDEVVSAAVCAVLLPRLAFKVLDFVAVVVALLLLLSPALPSDGLF